MDDSKVHIFWDHSNVFLSAQRACDDGKGAGYELGHRLDARVHFRRLYDFAAAGRTVERAVAVGSIPPGLSALWSSLEGAGVAISLQERGAESGKEQAVDEALQLEMLRSVADRSSPAVAVLLTGDGGFEGDARRMLDAGWGVEVLCFAGSLSGKLRGIPADSHGRGKYVELDPWYRQVVYLQGLDEDILRPADPLDLTGRPRV